MSCPQVLTSIFHSIPSRPACHLVVSSVIDVIKQQDRKRNRHRGRRKGERDLVNVGKGKRQEGVCHVGGDGVVGFEFETGRGNIIAFELATDVDGAGSVEPSSSGQVVHGAAKMDTVEAKMGPFARDANRELPAKAWVMPAKTADSGWVDGITPPMLLWGAPTDVARVKGPQLRPL